MATLTGAQLVARMLKAEGVSTSSRSPACTSRPSTSAASRKASRSSTPVTSRRRRTRPTPRARLTRGLGVCSGHGGPRRHRRADRRRERVCGREPGAAPRRRGARFNQGSGSLQEMEQVDLFTRITKWSDRIPVAGSGAELPGARHSALMLTGRPGPVFLEIAWDVLSNGVEETRVPAAVVVPHATRGSPGIPRFVERAAALLGKAERPVIIAGSSIWWDDAADAAAPRFAERAGAAGLPERRRARLPAARSPALLPAARARTRWRRRTWCWSSARRSISASATAPGHRARARRSSRWTSTPPRSAATARVEVGIVGDSRSVLEQLDGGAARAVRVATAGFAGCASASRRRLRGRRSTSRSRPGPHPPLPAGEASSTTSRARRATACSSPTAATGWRSPPRCIALAQAGALARSRAARMPRRGRAVRHRGQAAPPRSPGLSSSRATASFGLNGMDFETALRFKLPMVAVVGNDAAWGRSGCRRCSSSVAEKSPATQLAPTRYDQVVEALGGYGEHVDRSGADPSGAGARRRLGHRRLRERRCSIRRRPPPAARKAMPSESTAVRSRPRPGERAAPRRRRPGAARHRDAARSARRAGEEHAGC